MSNSHPKFDKLYPIYDELAGNTEHGQLYKPAETIIIDGHEVYWMEYHIPFGGDRNNIQVGHQVECQCTYTKGIGWEEYPPHGVSHLMPAEQCNYRKAAQYLRQREVRTTLEDRIGDAALFKQEDYYLTRATVANELRLRALSGEWIGQHSDGLIYMQEVAKCMDMEIHAMHETIDRAQKEKLFSLNGMIMTDHFVRDGSFKLWKTMSHENGYTADIMTPVDQELHTVRIYCWRDPGKTEQAFIAPFPLTVAIYGEMGGGWEYGWEERVEKETQRLFNTLAKWDLEKNPIVKEPDA